MIDSNMETQPSFKKRRRFLDSFFAHLFALKPSDAFLLRATLICVVVFFLLSAITLSTRYGVTVPTRGGTFAEGIVGTPRFINPVLAVTRADKSLTALIYDGLMQLGPEGKLIPNIAESVTVSEDGLTYNVLIRQDIHFHDGAQLTAEDVVFTLNRIQEPQLGSPLLSNFDGVTIEKIGPFEVNIILTEAYAPFIENLTFGILPEHIWKDASSDEFPFSQHNSEPVGTGPYMIHEIIRDTSGIPEKYTLTYNPRYHESPAQIETLALFFFPTEEELLNAFTKGIIESIAGIDPKTIEQYEISNKTHTILQIPLPRTFAVFLNQNKSIALRDIFARRALDTALDRTTLVKTVLDGYGSALTSPVPPGFGIVTSTTTESTSGVEAARAILREGGWKIHPETQIWEKEIDKIITPLSFSIATANTNAFEETATYLSTTWKELGADVTIKQFEQSDLTQAVIRPREYETLLFGTQLGRSLDYYSFWHSSQRNDPGLNVALYANITTDSILLEMRRTGVLEEHEAAIHRFAEEIHSETPAIFLYAPELLYVFPKRIHGASFTGLSEPHERFAQIRNWYIETESVWQLFTD